MNVKDLKKKRTTKKAFDELVGDYSEAAYEENLWEQGGEAAWKEWVDSGVEDLIGDLNSESGVSLKDKIKEFNSDCDYQSEKEYFKKSYGPLDPYVFGEKGCEDQGDKNDDGLTQFDAIPPLGEFELAKAFTIGSKKYDNHNFRKGFKYGRLYSAMMRHAKKWLAGEQRDPKDGQHHLASVAWYALVLIEQEHRHPELDDRFKMDEAYIRKLHDMRG